jgi:hypothetical protein
MTKSGSGILPLSLLEKPSRTKRIGCEQMWWESWQTMQESPEGIQYE